MIAPLSPCASSLTKAFGRRMLFRMAATASLLLEAAATATTALVVTASFFACLLGFASMTANAAEGSAIMATRHLALAHWPLALAILGAWWALQIVLSPNLRARLSWRRPLGSLGRILLTGVQFGFERFLQQTELPPPNGGFLSPKRHASYERAAIVGPTPTRALSCLAPLRNAVHRWVRMPQALPHAFLSLPLGIAALPLAASGVILILAEAAASELFMAALVFASAPRAPASPISWLASAAGSFAAALASTKRSYIQSLASEAGLDLAASERALLGGSIPPGKPGNIGKGRL